MYSAPHFSWSAKLEYPPHVPTATIVYCWPRSGVCWWRSKLCYSSSILAGGRSAADQPMSPIGSIQVLTGPKSGEKRGGWYVPRASAIQGCTAAKSHNSLLRRWDGEESAKHSLARWYEHVQPYKRLVACPCHSNIALSLQVIQSLTRWLQESAGVRPRRPSRLRELLRRGIGPTRNPATAI